MTNEMDPQPIQLQQNHQLVLDRFMTSCESDERVVAAFIGGSYAKGQVDAFSDLDLYLITTDGKYEDFLAGREAFVHLLGKPLFLEDFGEPYGLFYIFSNGTEGELWTGRESQFNHIHSGPYRVLLDKKGVLTKVVFAAHKADQAGQMEAALVGIRPTRGDAPLVSKSGATPPRLRRYPGGRGAVLQGRTGASQRAISVFAGDLLSNGAKGNVPGCSRHS